MAVTHYRELVAWQKAMELAEAVHRVTRAFPKEELYGLSSQLRRSAVSVPSNIAEGQGRGAGAEFAHHLRIANGSRQEVETQIILAQRLGYLKNGEADPLLALTQELGRILTGLLRSVMPRS